MPFYGAAAFQKGKPPAPWLDSLAHFFIAFAVAAIYVGATLFLPRLNKDAVMWGAIYGTAVFSAGELCPATADSRREIALSLAALKLNGLLGTFYSLAYRSPCQPDAVSKPVQPQHSGGFDYKRLIGSTPEEFLAACGHNALAGGRLIKREGTMF